MKEKTDRVPITLNLSLLPILLPMAVIGLMAGGVTFTRNMTGMSAAPRNAVLNTTEETLLGYIDVTKTLGQNDGATLSALHRLATAPLTLKGSGFRHAEIAGYMPSTVLLSTATQVANHARSVAASGDMETAQQYIASLHELSDRLLRTTEPTMETLRVAYRIQLSATIAAAEIEPVGSGARRQAESHVAALKAFWGRQVAPRMRPHTTPAFATTPTAELCRDFRDGIAQMDAE